MRQARHEAVGQEFHGVAAHQVAHEQALADEHGIEERPVVVGYVELFEPPVDAGQVHGDTAHAEAALVARDPECGVRRGNQKVSRWGRDGLRLATSDHSDRESPCDDGLGDDTLAGRHSSNIHP